MDFGFSEEQELLRKSAAHFLAKECPMTYVRQMMDDERGYADGLWNKMAELGWTGLIYPEEYGGAGLSIVDLVVVLEEMGKACFFLARSFRLRAWVDWRFLKLAVQNRSKSICQLSLQEKPKPRLPFLRRTHGGTNKGSTSRLAKGGRIIAFRA